MSHQRYSSNDTVKEPHSVSLKVLRLSRPSLVLQYPIEPPLASNSSCPPPIAASLAYGRQSGAGEDTNPEPFILSPILNLPPSFGSAYVGETFSCTLCANHDIPDAEASKKTVRDVRIEAEMKTPTSQAVTKLDLDPEQGGLGATKGVDLEPDETLQKVVNFDLKEEGNHVLAVTVSYYEATDISGRTRTFRKLYQFICKASLIVRTKPGPLPAASTGVRRWVLEAQLENCSEDTIQLERLGLDTEPGLVYSDCNWEASGSSKPVLHPGEVEQVCFVVEETEPGRATASKEKQHEGKIILGVLGIGWRSEMGNKGFLATGKLGTKHIKAPEKTKKSA
ncbi:hypothetical protein GQ53DRAFT_654305 [Thozetella sp. PMI_491]|nr:hypothetical protein GQ53DRAFT_654305 [Thozetella sp. PMI_491]